MKKLLSKLKKMTEIEAEELIVETLSELIVQQILKEYENENKKQVKHSTKTLQ